MCDMTWTHSHVRHDSVRYATWLVRTLVRHRCVTCRTRSYATNLIQMCDMTHWRGSFICATSPILLRATAHSCVWHDSFTCVRWTICATSLNHICNMARFSACSCVSQQGLPSAIFRAEHLWTSNELCVLSKEPHFRASYEFDLQTLFDWPNLLTSAIYVYVYIYKYLVLGVQHLPRRALFPIETTHWSWLICVCSRGCFWSIYIWFMYLYLYIYIRTYISIYICVHTYIYI